MFILCTFGCVGPRGPIGNPGHTGPVGGTGSPGSRGPDGFTGSTGEPGATGQRRPLSPVCTLACRMSLEHSHSYDLVLQTHWLQRAACGRHADQIHPGSDNTRGVGSSASNQR